MRQRVSENVKVLMARRGVRQPQIMAILGMSQAAVSRRLNGQHPWDIDELERISAAFEVPVTELVWAPENPRPDQPDEGSGDVVRREGIEPPTRWFRGVTPIREIRHEHSKAA